MRSCSFLAETAGFEPACPKGANAFRVRLVMTTSIRLHVVVGCRMCRRAYSQLTQLIAGFGLVPYSPSVFAAYAAHYGLRLSTIFAERIRNLRCSSRASPYSDKLTEYCLHASMTQYPVSLSLHGSLPTRTLYHISKGLQGEVVR